ncbi:MAG: hypothetical protein ABRQ39_31000, partial [Candidatus Eremiobacterota bacterium]
ENSEIPPLYLFYGTHINNMASIYVRGIEDRNSGWAFFARDIKTASSYGERWGAGDYVIFRILSQEAYQKGVRFEKREDYYVCRYLPPVFIDFHWTIADLAYRYDALV